MVISKVSQSGTTVSGTVSVNLGAPAMGLVRQIVVDPATDSTTFDFAILNPQSIIIFERISETGTFSEMLTGLPMIGIYTLRIQSATNDEAFTFDLMMQT